MISCFLLEPTGKVRHSLRRFCWSSVAQCAGRYGYHNAERPLCILAPQNDGDRTSGDFWPHDAAGWPGKCDHCDYLFLGTDQWQRSSQTVYARPFDGQLFTLQDAPVGAMWWADWLTGHHEGKHHALRGGPHLVVKTPGGDWDIDAPSNMPDGSYGDGWQRTGTPPRVTVMPSISIPGAYHGHLTDGKLIPC